MKVHADNTDDYLAALAPDQKRALQDLRTAVRSAAPGAEETMSSGVPAFRYRGMYLVSFAAAKSHVALLVMSDGTLEKLRSKLTRYDAGRRIIRFQPDHPLPPALIRELVDLRLREIEATVESSNPAPSRSQSRL